MTEHPADVADVLTKFSYQHLPERLQAISKDFHDLAHIIANRAPGKRETIKALDRLLESKDAAVRAAL